MRAVSLVVLLAAVAGLASAQTRATTALASLDFSEIIGGPMGALVDAQIAAAQASLDFIQTFGFEAPTNDGNPPQARTLEFGYTKQNENGVSTKEVLTVPALSLIPIPYLKLDRASFTFNARIDSSLTKQTQTSSNTVNSAAQFSAATGLKCNGDVARQSQTNNNQKVQSQFGLGVTVEVSTADPPDGFTKIMDKLLDSIKTTKTPAARS